MGTLIQQKCNVSNTVICECTQKVPSNIYSNYSCTLSVINFRWAEKTKLKVILIHCNHVGSDWKAVVNKYWLLCTVLHIYRVLCSRFYFICGEYLLLLTVIIIHQ